MGIEVTAIVDRFINSSAAENHTRAAGQEIFLVNFTRMAKIFKGGISSWLGLASRKLGSRQSSSYMKMSHEDLDPTQLALLNEPCIAVDLNDQATGSISKKDAHLLGPENQLPPLHRAFSVFLFNTRNELLMQQRSQCKITFPGYYTNSCCSHPLHYPDELDETDNIGVLRAARRRLEIELGIDPKDIELSEFKLLTRIHYGAPSSSKWGEHEIDYILFLKKDIPVKPNPNEVEQVTYVSLDKFSSFHGELIKSNIRFTPWFDLILNSYLIEWWKQVANIDDLTYDSSIHSL